ncbi:Chaperone protein DnaJ [Diplonema papillatum]|nr:Chaperone protein DnaJ [Diplonema papillatum]|eukprot:gene1257-1945_t
MRRTLRVLAKDYYAVLGLRRGATEDDIKKAYKVKAAQLHPDVSKRPNAAAEFSELNNAYESLKSGKKRDFYHATGSSPKSDEDLKGYEDFVRQQEQMHRQRMAYNEAEANAYQQYMRQGGGGFDPSGMPRGWRRFEQNPWEEEWASEDIPFYATSGMSPEQWAQFHGMRHPSEHWAGGGTGTRSRSSSNRKRDRNSGESRSGKADPTMPKSGGDCLCTVELTAEEALQGTSKIVSFKIDRNCWTCNGTGINSALDANPPCSICGGMGEYMVQLTPQEVAKVTCEGCGGTGVICRPCHKCKGKAVMTTDTSMTVGLPPGLDTGSIVRLVQQGHHGTNGGTAGDLVLSIKVSQHHKRFVRGADGSLHVTVPIPLSLALLGGQTTIKGINNEDVVVDVKPGTQHLSSTELNAKGCLTYPRDKEIRILPNQKPEAKAEHRKLVGHFVVAFPDKLTDQQREVIRTLIDSGMGSPKVRQLQQDAMTFLRARHFRARPSEANSSKANSNSNQHTNNNSNNNNNSKNNSKNNGSSSRPPNHGRDRPRKSRRH